MTTIVAVVKVRSGDACTVKLVKPRIRKGWDWRRTSREKGFNATLLPSRKMTLRGYGGAVE